MRKIITVGDIAKQIKRTTAYVRQEIRAGRLRAEKFGRDWLISEEDYNKWQKKRRPRR